MVLLPPTSLKKKEQINIPMIPRVTHVTNTSNKTIGPPPTSNYCIQSQLPWNRFRCRPKVWGSSMIASIPYKSTDSSIGPVLSPPTCDEWADWQLAMNCSLRQEFRNNVHSLESDLLILWPGDVQAEQCETMEVPCHVIDPPERERGQNRTTPIPSWCD